jgi:PHD/YefM family antitoxin component YafN of YafNO toxin-antitoxin module
MALATETVQPEFIINKKGTKKAVILSLKEYQSLIDILESLEDANDLLRAEREATEFIPYEKFRKKWLKD